ncbi:MAG: cyclic nucleotide-binding domain-containing protein [Thermoanaerobaculia bacterium]|nr:cyclic nucleotide-binding domain-containing protein [Thermoanaerobaculia bacterium]
MVDGRLTSDVAVRESLEVCEFLAKVPAFRRYTPGALAEIAEELTLRKLPSGTSVFRQGDPGDEFYVVWKGRVAIVDEAADERLAVLGPGQFFGEMALVSGKPRNASAVVEEDAELLSLNKDEFQRALQREKDFHRQLRETLTLRSL